MSIEPTCPWRRQDVHHRAVFERGEVGVEYFFHLGVGAEVDGSGGRHPHQVSAQTPPQGSGAFHLDDISVGGTGTG